MNNYLNTVYIALGTYNLSFAFVVFFMFVMALYMFFRNVRHTRFLGVLAFLTECILLTVAMLSLSDKVLIIPAFEILFIVGGILLPAFFLLTDYMGMKRRVRVSAGPVRLVEKFVRKPTIVLEAEWTLCPDAPGAMFSADVVSRTLQSPDSEVLRNAKEQIKEAQKFMEEDELAEADRIYISLASIIPLDSAGYCNAGWLRYRSKAFDEAIRQFRKAIALSAKEKKSAVKQQKQGKTEASFEPTEWFARFGIACAFFGLESYEDALFEFQKAALILEASAALQRNIARCHLLLGYPEKAMEELEKALVFDSSSDTRLALAKVFMQMTLREGAVLHLETLVATERNMARAYEILGGIYRKERNFEKAEPLFAHLIKLEPENANAWFHLASCRRHLGQMEEALVSYKTAIRIKPNFSRALYGAAATLEEKGEMKEAVSLLQQSLAGNESMEKTYNLLGSIYQEEGRMRDAVAVYEEAVAKFPESGLLQANLGAAQEMAGFSERAVKPLKNAIKLGENDNVTYTLLVKALFELKHYHDAVRVLKEGTASHVEDAGLWYLSARAKAHCHDTDGAIDDLETAVNIEPDMRLDARSCSDFTIIRTAPGFIDLIRLPMIQGR